jgi:hypothetical protein
VLDAVSMVLDQCARVPIFPDEPNMLVLRQPAATIQQSIKSVNPVDHGPRIRHRALAEALKAWVVLEQSRRQSTIGNIDNVGGEGNRLQLGCLSAIDVGPIPKRRVGSNQNWHG